jgi:hypothetical protein
MEQNIIHMYHGHYLMPTPSGDFKSVTKAQYFSAGLTFGFAKRG